MVPTSSGPRVVFGLAAGAALAVAAVLTVPVLLLAQEDDAPVFSVDASGGLAVPAADLDDFTDPGGSVGAGVAVHLGRHVALHAGVDYQRLGGATDTRGTTFPDIDVLHALGGLEFLFTEEDRRDTRWTASLGAGAGISSMVSDETLDGGGPAPVILDARYVSFEGSAKLGYQATSAVNVFFEPRTVVIVSDRADSQVFASLSPDVTPWDVMWVVPLHLGARISLR